MNIKNHNDIIEYLLKSTVQNLTAHNESFIHRINPSTHNTITWYNNNTPTVAFPNSFLVIKLKRQKKIKMKAEEVYTTVSSPMPISKAKNHFTTTEYPTYSFPLCAYWISKHKQNTQSRLLNCTQNRTFKKMNIYIFT